MSHSRTRLPKKSESRVMRMCIVFRVGFDIGRDGDMKDRQS